MTAYFCGLGNAHVFLCLVRHDYRLVLFLSQTITVTEWYNLMSMFYEIIYVQQENVKAYLWVSGQLPDVKDSFSLSHTLNSVLLGLLHSPQSSMIKFTMNSKFLHLGGRGGVVVFPWGPICKSVNSLLLCSSFIKQRHSSTCQLSALLGNDKTCSIVHVLQKCHTNTKYWPTQELIADTSKFRKGSSFWEASQGIPHTLHLGKKASKLRILEFVDVHTFVTNTYNIASQSPYFTLLLPSLQDVSDAPLSYPHHRLVSFLILQYKKKINT